MKIATSSKYDPTDSNVNIHKLELIQMEKRPDLIKKDFEHYQQTLFFSELFDKHHDHYEFFSSIPNGGFRLKGERWRLKAEGQKKGMPDTQFTRARHGYHALFLEFKKPYLHYPTISKARAAVAPHQLKKLIKISKEGYAVAIAYGAEEAMMIFEAYLKSREAFEKLELFFPLINND